MHLSGRKKIEVANRVELHACTDYARTHRSITRQLNQNSRGACTTRQIKKKLALGQRWRLRRQKIGGAFPLLRLTRAPAKTTQRRGWLLGRAKILALNRTRTESYGRANFFVRLSLTSIQTNHKHLAHPTFFFMQTTATSSITESGTNTWPAGSSSGPPSTGRSEYSLHKSRPSYYSLPLNSKPLSCETQINVSCLFGLLQCLTAT
jgi:hypothetical protein